MCIRIECFDLAVKGFMTSDPSEDVVSQSVRLRFFCKQTLNDSRECSIIAIGSGHARNPPVLSDDS